MDELHLGLSNSIPLPKGSFLFIGDEVPPHPKAKIFDPTKHSFNPLKNLSKKSARELAEVLYTASPQGENTLTVRTGRRALAQALATATRFDDISIESPIKGVKEEVEGMVGELLFTDLMRRALCADDDFSFTGKNTKVFARLNRAELGDFDALVLGLFLMAQYQGQFIVPDGGFYLRDSHVRFVREGRLICGAHTLKELPEALLNSLPRFDRRIPSRTTYENALELARYDCPFPPRTNEHDAFIQRCRA
jgi:hypothetical protein